MESCHGLDDTVWTFERAPIYEIQLLDRILVAFPFGVVEIFFNTSG
jgi:hypothetical protein